MMRRVGSIASPLVQTSTAGTVAKSLPTQAKRSYINFTPSVAHFGSCPPQGGSSKGGSGACCSPFSGASCGPADPSSGRAAPGPEELFRQVMQQGAAAMQQHQQQQQQQQSRPAPTASQAAKKPATRSSHSYSQSTTAPNPTGASAAKKEAPQAKVPHPTASHPFMQMFESLGDAAPLAIHESPNHCTVEMELPLSIQVKDPKVTIHRRDASSSAASSPEEDLMEMLMMGDTECAAIAAVLDGSRKSGGQQPGKQQGNVTLSAEISPKLTLHKMQQHKGADPLKAMLGQMGLPVEQLQQHLEQHGMPACIGKKTVERTFTIDESIYNLQQATPFVEEGKLRLYVPKKKFTQQSPTPKPAATTAARPSRPLASSASCPPSSSSFASCGRPFTREDASNEVNQKGSLDSKFYWPQKGGNCSPFSSTSCGSAAAAPASRPTSTCTPRSCIPEDIPKCRQEVKSCDARFSWAQAGRPSPGQPTSTASSSAPASRCPAQASTAAAGSWPPRVETNAQGAMAVIHSISIPSAVDADTISLEFNGGAAESGAVLADSASSVLQLTIEQESQMMTAQNQGESVVRTFYRYFEVPAEVKVDTVTCDFDASTRQLTVRVPKPAAPKKESPTTRRISITKRN